MRRRWDVAGVVRGRVVRIKGIFAREVEAAPKRENERYGLQCYVYAGDQSSDTVCFS